MSIDLQLDQNSYDLVITDYQIMVTNDPQQIVQNIKQRLLHFLGEWFLDRAAGTPWIESILIKGARTQAVSAILKARITLTGGVDRLTAFAIEAGGEREMLVDYVAIAQTNDPITDTITITI